MIIESKYSLAVAFQVFLMLNHIYRVVLSKSLSMSPIFVWCALRIMGSFGPMSRISVPTQLFGIYKMPNNALQPTAQPLCGFASAELVR